MSYTVKANMTWIEETAEEHLDNMQKYGVRREPYRKTLHALREIGSPDDVQEVSDWIMEYVEDYGRSPEADHVKSRAKRVCHKRGYEIPMTSYLVK